MRHAEIHTHSLKESLRHIWIILPKSESPGSPDSADSFEFSAERFLRTRKVSKLHCLQSYWLSFPLFMFSHCNKLSIKTLKHTIFSTKMPHWHQILVIFMIYALFFVAIYALFPQICWGWKAKSADFYILGCMDLWHLKFHDIWYFMTYMII